MNVNWNIYISVNDVGSVKSNVYDGGYPVPQKESHAVGRFVAANRRQSRSRIRHIGFATCDVNCKNITQSDIKDTERDNVCILILTHIISRFSVVLLLFSHCSILHVTWEGMVDEWSDVINNNKNITILDLQWK